MGFNLVKPSQLGGWLSFGCEGAGRRSVDVGVSFSNIMWLVKLLGLPWFAVVCNGQ